MNRLDRSLALLRFGPELRFPARQGTLLYQMFVREETAFACLRAFAAEPAEDMETAILVNLLFEKYRESRKAIQDIIRRN